MTYFTRKDKRIEKRNPKHVIGHSRNDINHFDWVYPCIEKHNRSICD